MNQAEIRKQWESAAPGWAKWEETVANWIAPATEAMLEMADVVSGASVLDLACGAGSQTIIAAERVGPQGHVLASDISETMLQHVRENARAAHLDHISTLLGAAEQLEVSADSFDAVISRLGLMLFPAPDKALATTRYALRPGGKVSVVVFTTAAANPFMAQPMQILLRHAEKEPPSSGQPGIFSLGSPGVLEQLLRDSGFEDVEKQTMHVPLRMPSAVDALQMIQEAFGAYRAVVSERSEAVRKAAWTEVADILKDFENSSGFEASAEVMIAAGRMSV